MHSAHILLLSESLDYGESLRDECPECKAKERTLSVTKTGEGVVLYQCFRASCALQGGLCGVSKSRMKRLTHQMKHKVWEGDTVALPQEVIVWLEKNWGLPPPRTSNWYYTEDYGGRIAMSVRSPANTHRGWVLRSDGSQPKALTYLDSGEVGLSWHHTSSELPCTVVVEDIPSAIRASAYVNAVSLLGTGCGDDKGEEIAAHAPRPIYIALDQDATDEAIELQKRYSLLWDGPRVLPLKQDLKNMNEADLCTLLKTIQMT